MFEHFASASSSQDDNCTRVWSQLSMAAWGAVATQLATAAVVNTILRQGLETNPDMLDRIAFLSNKTLLWTSGWLVEQVGSLALLYFYATFVWAHERQSKSLQSLLKLTLLLATAGVAVDFAVATIEMAVLPELACLSLPELVRGAASSLSHQLFLVVHRSCALLNGYLATGLLSISAVILAWLTHRSYVLWIWIAGIATGISGIAFSVACLTNSLPAMLWANVILEPCSLVWLAGIAVTANKYSRA
ncbi:MAG: hypothetical protein HY711_09670 [Candidatus Melainabacteria bacterium]|nr:hypothetical protein [Candidatus Melainabacteria bacterium]